MLYASRWDAALRDPNLRCLASRDVLASGSIGIAPMHELFNGCPIVDPSRFDGRLVNFAGIVSLARSRNATPMIDLGANTLLAVRFTSDAQGTAMRTTLFRELGKLDTQSYLERPSGATVYVLRLGDTKAHGLERHDVKFLTTGLIEYIPDSEQHIASIPDAWAKLVAGDVDATITRIIIDELRSRPDPSIPAHAIRVRRNLTLSINGSFLFFPEGSLVTEPGVIASIAADDAQPASQSFRPRKSPPGSVTFLEDTFVRIGAGFLDKRKGDVIPDADDTLLIELVRAGTRIEYRPKEHTESEPAATKKRRQTVGAAS